MLPRIRMVPVVGPIYYSTMRRNFTIRRPVRPPSRFTVMDVTPEASVSAFKFNAKRAAVNFLYDAHATIVCILSSDEV